MSGAGTTPKWSVIDGTSAGKRVIEQSAPKSRRNVAQVGGPLRVPRAHLIAASPVLYEALEEVVRKFEAAPDSVRNVPLGIMKARAALALARGEHPESGT